VHCSVENAAALGKTIVKESCKFELPHLKKEQKEEEEEEEKEEDDDDDDGEGGGGRGGGGGGRGGGGEEEEQEDFGCLAAYKLPVFEDFLH